MKKVVVFGLGGIGGYVGAKLAGFAAGGADVEVSFVARGAHLQAIRDKGLSFRAPDGSVSLLKPAQATDDAGSLGVADYVFLCVKGYDLEDACRSILPSIGDETVVLPLLNGADIYQRVRRVIKTGIVLPGAIYISGSVVEPGKVAHISGAGNIVLGREAGVLDYDPAPLLSLLDGAGIPYQWFEDPLPAIWTKYLFIASFGLVTARSGLGIGQAMAVPEWAAAIQGIQSEIVAVAAASGVTLPSDAADQAFKKGAAFPPETTTSFQRDVAVEGKPNEGELFGGTILALGKQLGVPTPMTEKVYGEILKGRA